MPRSALVPLALLAAVACSNGPQRTDQATPAREGDAPEGSAGSGGAAPSSDAETPLEDGETGASPAARPADGSQDQGVTETPSAVAAPDDCVDASEADRFVVVPCDPSLHAYNGTSVALCGNFDDASYADFEGSLLQPEGWTSQNGELIRNASEQWDESYQGGRVAWVNVATDFYASAGEAADALEETVAQNALGWGAQRAGCAGCEWPTEANTLPGGQALVLPGWLEVGPAAASSAPVQTPGHLQMRMWAAYDNVLLKIDGMAFNPEGGRPRDEVLCEIDAIIRSLRFE